MDFQTLNPKPQKASIFLNPKSKTLKGVYILKATMQGSGASEWLRRSRERSRTEARVRAVGLGDYGSGAFFGGGGGVLPVWGFRGLGFRV